MRQELNIVKVGGAVVEDDAGRGAFLREFANLECNKILVHGGGRTATAIASRLGIETKMVEGRRVTGAAMLEVVTMVYVGLVNKKVVAAPLTYCAADGGLLNTNASLLAKDVGTTIENGIDNIQ